ncbi:sulfite exporter TauE/SafE family protein [Leifsonia aquatica]|uniref:sulfite exporter TauE/SafE family protein n=1 Tax=Leifsonia aquatica TaxID=144185 RepID=UPI000468D61D|nr:sulfite exporter TauE/SafE family protein [Leifsonia aquatica]
MTTAEILVVCGAMFVGAVAQRVTGMGFALVVSPFLVLLLGPFDGVMLVNLASIVSATIVLVSVWRDVDPRAYAWLASAAVVGVVPGALLATRVDPAVLETVIGGVLILSLTASLLMARLPVTVSGPAPRLAAGFVSGLMNAAAGVGGPAVSAYGILSRWPHRSFAATLQPYFATVGLASVIAKLVIAPGALPDLGAVGWGGAVVSLVAGVAVGTVAARRLAVRWARIAVIVIAFAGAAVALVNGIVHLAGAA